MLPDLQQRLAQAIHDYSYADPRSKQSRDGILGPSDLGFCRQKAVLTTREVARTDETNEAAARIGTAIHRYVAQAFAQANQGWIADSEKVTATFPSGVAISGTPDLICPSDNAIIDVKTVDGFEWVKRNGTSQNHKYQRHAYALGAMQAGLLDGSQTVYVGNMYIDRSGKEPEPFFIIEEFDPSLTGEVDSWIGDVIYAVKNGEDASRDIPAAVCEKICPFFTACRGGLEVHDGGTLIEDAELLAAVDMYVEARELSSHAEQMKKEAQRALSGINGSTGTYQVRWVEVAPTTIQSFEKAGYLRMDVRKVRK
ncbi:MAG: hypothetical protein KGN78_05765 [Actinomycetales bacterium]|nr:hypothetical protein [Actinomycetales bacterium]